MSLIVPMNPLLRRRDPANVNKTDESTKNAYTTEMQSDEEGTHRNYTYVTPVHDQTNDSPIIMYLHTDSFQFSIHI